MMRRRILALGSFLTLTAVVLGRPQTEPAQPSGDPPAGVELTIDYGDGAQKRFPEAPWRESTTVLDVMQWAAEHPHGIKMTVRGRGDTALVTRIDDLKNGGSEDRSWIYRVNGKLADRSCGVFPIKSGDTVLWKYERYQ